MKDRIIIARKHLGLTQTEFGTQTGATRSMIAAYEGGKVVPSDTWIELVSMKFGVSMSWLRTGEGPMLAEHNRPDAQLMRQYAFSALVGKLLMTFGELPEQQQEQLLQRARELAQDVADTP